MGVGGRESEAIGAIAIRFRACPDCTRQCTQAHLSSPLLHPSSTVHCCKSTLTFHVQWTEPWPKKISTPYSGTSLALVVDCVLTGQCQDQWGEGQHTQMLEAVECEMGPSP